MVCGVWLRGPAGAVFTVVRVGAGQGRGVGDPGSGVNGPHWLSWTRKRRTINAFQSKPWISGGHF